MDLAYAERLYRRRRLKNAVALVLSGAAAIFGLFWLVWILWTTVSKGFASLNIDLFAMMTPPPDQPGGLLNAFFGSAVISLMGIAMGTPIGVAAGTWLAEYANHRKIGKHLSAVPFPGLHLSDRRRNDTW